MTVAGPESGPWPRKRWLAGWLIVFVGLVGCIVLLSRETPTPRPSSESRVHLLLDRSASETELEQMAVPEPALFALPHVHGFSGAWMKQSNLTHRLSRWEPPERWLPLNTNDWGAPLATLLPSNRPSVLPVSRKATPDLRLPVPPPLLVKTNSMLEIGAALTNRRASNSPPIRLPEWNAPDVLKPTVVQVMVNPAGLVLTARLIKRSGLASADQRALAVARQMRFSTVIEVAHPLITTQFTTGDVTFRWATRAAAVTNITPARLP